MLFMLPCLQPFRIKMHEVSWSRYLTRLQADRDGKVSSYIKALSGQKCCIKYMYVPFGNNTNANKTCLQLQNYWECTRSLEGAEYIVRLGSVWSFQVARLHGINRLHLGCQVWTTETSFAVNCIQSCMLNIHFVIYCQFGLQSDFMISLLLYSLQQNLTLRELIKCVCVCVHAYTNKYMPTLAFRLSRERPTGLHLHIQVTCLI